MDTLARRYGFGTASGRTLNADPQNPSPEIPTWQPWNQAASEPPAWALTEQLGEPRHRLWHWLYSEETWLPLAQADLIHHKRLRKLTQRLWPNRPPHWDPRQQAYVYSWRKLEALCTAAIAEREAKLAQGRLHRWGVQ